MTRPSEIMLCARPRPSLAVAVLSLFVAFDPEWQFAEMCPSWSRWLPCSVQLLRVVPDLHSFPRSAWDDGPAQFDWDALVWCDPGDPDDWVARAIARHLPGDEELAARHAREDYETRVKIRAERIDLFTTMCRRAGVAPPATLSQLLHCLLDFDLYREHQADGEIQLQPRLWRNPLDVLPFSQEEAIEEVGHQQRERALLAGAGLRKLAQAGCPRTTETGTVTVTVALRAVAEAARLPAGQIRSALALLVGDEILEFPEVDLNQTDLDAPLEVRLPWHFGPAFNFEELPPPEHLP